MNFEQALLDPTSVFSAPDDVAAELSLNREQKIKILRRWEYDARELQVAADENMCGGPPDRLEQILATLHRLGVDRDLEHAPPTKQGGAFSRS